MVARKPDFALLADSAASRASRKSRAFGHLKFEMFAMMRQMNITLANFAHHGVEAIDQNADFVIGVGFECNAVIVLLADARHRMREIDQRARDRALQLQSDQQRK